MIKIYKDWDEFEIYCPKNEKGICLSLGVQSCKQRILRNYLHTKKNLTIEDVIGGICK